VAICVPCNDAPSAMTQTDAGSTGALPCDILCGGWRFTNPDPGALPADSALCPEPPSGGSLEATHHALSPMASCLWQPSGLQLATIWVEQLALSELLRRPRCVCLLTRRVPGHSPDGRRPVSATIGDPRTSSVTTIGSRALTPGSPEKNRTSIGSASETKNSRITCECRVL
jgi:hypothetical protein